MNLYRYAGDNPINGIDTLGLKIWPFSGPIHGMWCGGDWSGGQNDEYRDGTGPGYYQDPTDALDSVCRDHDKSYYSCRQKYPCDREKRKQCMSDCNTALYNAAETIGGAMGVVIRFGMIMPPDPGPNAASCGCVGKK